jgi:hypothetical protein
MIFAVALILCAPTAKAAEGKGSALSVSGGTDIVDKYFFRGLLVQDQGLIAQPYLDLNVDLGGVHEGLSMVIGTWHSVQSNSPSPAGGSTGQAHQEFDWYIGFSAAIVDNVEGTVTYTEYTVPAGGPAVDEIAFSISLDDSEAFGGMGLSPHLMVAFETDGGSDAAVGGNSGIYLEIGIEPTFELVKSETNPIDLAIPVVVGLSLDDYYEFVSPTTGKISDEALGYVSASLVLSTPFHWIPEEYGAWTLSAGVEFLLLGDNTEGINGGEDFEVNVNVGLSFEQ